MSNEKKDVRSRNWLLTMPYESITEYELKEKIKSYNYVGQQEIGESGYHHYRVFVQGKNPIKFSTLKGKFPKAHIETMKGSTQQLYDYVTKDETQVKDSSFSNGEMKLSNQGAIKMSFEDLRDKIKGGERLDDLILSEPITGPMHRSLEVYEQALIRKKASSSFRHVEVNYIYGESGTGKTRYVYEKYGYDQVYRISNYKNPFDTYLGQDVLVLDEFYESIEFGYLLNVLDGYPLQLSARYFDRWAQYTKVYILSNRRLDKQFVQHAYYDEEEYLPFLRRINNNYVKTEDNIYLFNDYLDSKFPPEKRG